MALYPVAAQLSTPKVPPGDGTAYTAEPGLGSLALKIAADLVVAHGFGLAESVAHPSDHTSVVYSGVI